MYNLFLSLSPTTFASPRTFLLPDTKALGGYDAVRCAGITTNEVLNLNKLQGTRLPSAFSSLLRPPQFIPCQLIFRILSHREGRSSRTRNGDMNIPGVEYPRAVNLFGTTRMVAGAAFIFPAKERILARAAAGKILRLNKRQRFSPPTPIFGSL